MIIIVIVTMIEGGCIGGGATQDTVWLWLLGYFSVGPLKPLCELQGLNEG